MAKCKQRLITLGPINDLLNAAKCRLRRAESDQLAAVQEIAAITRLAKQLGTGQWRLIDRDQLHEGCVYFVRGKFNKEVSLARWMHDGWSAVNGSFVPGPLGAIWIPADVEKPG